LAGIKDISLEDGYCERGIPSEVGWPLIHYTKCSMYCRPTYHQAQQKQWSKVSYTDCVVIELSLQEKCSDRSEQRNAVDITLHLTAAMDYTQQHGRVTSLYTNNWHPWPPVSARNLRSYNKLLWSWNSQSSTLHRSTS